MKTTGPRKICVYENVLNRQKNKHTQSHTQSGISQLSLSPLVIHAKAHRVGGEVSAEIW